MEFQFDEKNRMTQYHFGGSGSWYQIKYDSLDRVRERIDLSPTTTKYYSDDRQLMQQVDSSNNVEFDYARGPTGLLRQWEENGSPTKRLYIKDPLGTIWALVDPSNLNVTRYNYTAWGEHLDKNDSDFPTDTNYMRYIASRCEAFGESTSQRDAIYHLDYRHYLPALGRFLQIDHPYLANISNIIMTTNVNPYLYSQNNPVTNADPHGLVSWSWDKCKIPSQDQICGCWNLEYGHVYYGTIQDGPTCYCDKHDYIDSLTFHEFWVFGYSPWFWSLHLKFGDIGINFGNQICNINVSTLPGRLLTKPDVCCHILAHCDRCSKQDEDKELSILRLAFIEVVQQHGQNGGGICKMWNWANMYPLKGLWANVLGFINYVYDAEYYQAVPCGCQDWQDTVYQKIYTTLNAIDSKCWRVCRTDWSLGGILPIHHWVTLESRSGTTRYSLDPWGGGNKLHKANLYETGYEFWGSIKKGECQAPSTYWPPGSLW